MTKFLSLLTASLLAGSQLASAYVKETSPSRKMAETVMNVVWKDTAGVPNSKPNHWTYDQGVVLKGIEGLWQRTGDARYFRYMQNSIDALVSEDGTIHSSYKMTDYNIDNVLNGRILLTLFKVTGKPKYYKAALTLREQLKSQPRTNEGGFWHKKRYPYQMWLDGLYMGEPFYAEWADYFKEDTTFNDIANQFIWMEKHARDSKTGLLYHGWDESKNEQWANKTTGLSENFWARAMGWYGMALVDALEFFPANHPQRKELIAILNRFSEAIVKVQDPKTGLWWDVMNFPNRDKNYPEASASCMLVYTMAKGMRLGYLPATYMKNAQKGYDGILKTFLETDASGNLNLNGTVSVSGLGGNPYRDGSYDYYMREKVIQNDMKGVGAFLLASNEMEIAPGLAKGKGKKVVLDSYFNNEHRKDASGMERSFHYKWEERDYDGFATFGAIFNQAGVTTETNYERPTLQALKGADMYVIVDPDWTKENPNPNYVSPEDANALYDWVKAGGVLLLMGNDTGNMEFQHFNTLAGKFGIQFKNDSRNRVTGSKFEMGLFTIPAGVPMLKEGLKVYMKEVATLNLSAPAKPAFTDNGDVIIAVSKVGKGTVMAVGDPWLYNEYTDGRKLPPMFQNFAAAEDLVQWLIAQTPKKK